MKKLERDVVRRLVETSRAIARMKQGGRGATGKALSKISGSPRLVRPKPATSRPTSLQGSTFHFRHTVKSKRNDMSVDAGSQTTASVHQAYIERKAAVEIVDERVVAEALGTDPGAAIFIDPGRASFGTLGGDKPERERFWRKVEASEGRTARVQSRIIAELPHEVDAAARIRMVRDFCASFDDHDLPWWASIHKPTGRNDDRNYHVHITYFDRPAKLGDDGVWDFERRETIKDEKGRKRTRRPFRRNKPQAVRDRSWVKTLRRRFADSANVVLEAGGFEKRYDPRPYRESGIEKAPTVHLGPKASALEDAGLDTAGGRINAEREARWRVRSAVAPWTEEAGWAMRFLAWGAREKPGLAGALDNHADIAEAGAETARLRTETDLFLQGSVSRANARAAFLARTRERLLRGASAETLDRMINTVGAIVSEGVVIEGALRDTEQTRRAIQAELERLSKEEERMRETLALSRRTIDLALTPAAEPAAPSHAKSDSSAPKAESEDAGRTTARKPLGDETAIRRALDAYGRLDRTSARLARHALEAPTLETAAATVKARDEMAQKLAEHPNRRLRALWSTTVDAAILSDDPALQRRRLLAVGMCENEARRRGLSLETGEHDPVLALDPAAGRRHFDDARGERRALARRELEATGLA